MNTFFFSDRIAIDPEEVAALSLARKGHGELQSVQVLVIVLRNGERLEFRDKRGSLFAELSARLKT